MGCYQDSASLSSQAWSPSCGKMATVTSGLLSNPSHQHHQKRRTFFSQWFQQRLQHGTPLALIAALAHKPIPYSLLLEGHDGLSGQARVTCPLLQDPHGPRVGRALSPERTGLPWPKVEGKNAGQAMPASNRRSPGARPRCRE